jgi:hypothetical protein
MKKIYTLLLLMSFVVGTGFTNDDVYSDGKTKITRFYPNPATSFINFEFDRILEKGHTLQIYSFIGNKVNEVQVSGMKTTITLDGYFRGIYCFRLIDRTGKIIDSGKFQVVK